MATNWIDLRPEDFKGETPTLFDLPGGLKPAAAELLHEPGSLFADEPEPWPTEDGRPLAVVDVLGSELFDGAGEAIGNEDLDDNAEPPRHLRAVPDLGPAFYVVPCSRQKLDHAAPARELYTGTMFRHTYAAAAAAAERDGGRVLILSAKHGLIDPERVLAPYEKQMGTRGSVWDKTALLADQARQLGIESNAEVTMLLPRAYAIALDRALRQLGIYASDLYEGCSGIGDQRHANNTLRGDDRA